MFEVTLEAEKLKKLVSAITLVDEGTFIADSYGLLLREMDTGKVAMIDLEIPAEFFDKYTCNENVAFPIDLSEFKKIIKRLKNETVVIELDDNNRLRITAKGTVERYFILPFLGIERTEKKKPTIPFLAKISLLPDVLKNAINDIKQFSDFAEFVATKQSFVIQSFSYNKEVGTKINPNDDCVLEYQVTEQCKALYPVNYLEDFVKVNAELVSIAFSTDGPLQMTYTIDNNAAAKVTYYLAPRREMP